MNNQFRIFFETLTEEEKNALINIAHKRGIEQAERIKKREEKRESIQKIKIISTMEIFKNRVKEGLEDKKLTQYKISKYLRLKGYTEEGTDKDGNTPLIRAIIRDDEEIAELMVEDKDFLKTYINMENSDGLKPLNYAMRMRKPNIYILLKSKGAKFSKTDFDIKYGYSGESLFSKEDDLGGDDLFTDDYCEQFGLFSTPLCRHYENFWYKKAYWGGWEIKNKNGENYAIALNWKSRFSRYY